MKHFANIVLLWFISCLFVIILFFFFWYRELEILNQIKWSKLDINLNNKSFLWCKEVFDRNDREYHCKNYLLLFILLFFFDHNAIFIMSISRRRSSSSFSNLFHENSSFFIKRRCYIIVQNFSFSTFSKVSRVSSSLILRRSSRFFLIAFCSSLLWVSKLWSLWQNVDSRRSDVDVYIDLKMKKAYLVIDVQRLARRTFFIQIDRTFFFQIDRTLFFQFDRSFFFQADRAFFIKISVKVCISELLFAINDSFDDDVSKLKKQMKKLKTRIEKLEKKLKTKQKTLNEINARFKNAIMFSKLMPLNWSY